MRIISGTARGTKLYTLEGENTRPTLDRVKESLFNIIQNDIEDKVVLDLFSGSGAIGLEALSRGASAAILCDKSKEAIGIINRNIEKTHSADKVKVYNMDFEKCLRGLNEEVDLIYLDPPYNTDFILKSLSIIKDSNILTNSTKIILETDDEQRLINKIEELDFEIIDKRKYGIAHIIFLKKKSLR